MRPQIRFGVRDRINERALLVFLVARLGWRQDRLAMEADAKVVSPVDLNVPRINLVIGSHEQCAAFVDEPINRIMVRLIQELRVTENNQNGLGRRLEEISELLNRLESASVQDSAKCVRTV